MRVLLVEDDTMIGESLEEGLRKENYAVDWVQDGYAADLALCNHSYDPVSYTHLTLPTTPYV